MITNNRDETARLAADVVLLAPRTGTLHVLVIKRKNEPYKNYWALPGGLLNRDEEFRGAAHRELGEETGIRVPELIEVSYYGNPGRDPRGRYVSVAFVAVLPALVDARPASDAKDARWVPASRSMRDCPLGFDHQRIITDALIAVGE